MVDGKSCRNGSYCSPPSKIDETSQYDQLVSLLAPQKLASFEVIVVDDGSTLDADEYFYPDKPSAVISEFNRSPGVGVVYNRIDIINEDGELLQSRRPKRIWQGSLGALNQCAHLTEAPTSGITAGSLSRRRC